MSMLVWLCGVSVWMGSELGRVPAGERGMPSGHQSQTGPEVSQIWERWAIASPSS